MPHPIVDIDLPLAKRIYRTAIDAKASDAEGADWWEEIRQEVEKVIDAANTEAAGEVIEWWHFNWEQVGDTPTGAAQRMREAYNKIVLEGTF